MLSRKRSWSDEDNARLKAHIEAGGSAFRASVIFKRSEAQVRAHATKLGLKFPSIRQLRAPALRGRGPR